MSDLLVIAYRPDFARLPDVQKRPIGTDAALMLSQADWLAENRTDAEGWFEWTTEQCEEQTGLTRRQQDTLRKRLCDAGYMERDRRAEKGRLYFRVHREQLHETVQQMRRDAPKRATETAAMRRDARNGATEEGQLHETVQQDARNGATEEHPVSTKETKTLEETIPPYTPQNGVPLPIPDEQARSLLIAFRSVRYPKEKPFTASDWQAYRANMRTLAQDGFTADQMREATQNALARWEKPEMVNPRSVSRHITALLEPASRGSPAKKEPLPLLTTEEKDHRMSVQLDRIFDKQGYSP